MNTLAEAPVFGPFSAGSRMSAAEFGTAEFEPGWRYELIRGVLVVSPAPLPQERGPNEDLGHWLKTYQETHAQGFHLDATLPEHDIFVGEDSRRADRVIWAGLGHTPDKDETPTIAIEFVSEGKRNELRDYQEKRIEYAAIGIREYWVIDRFRRTLTVFTLAGGERIVDESESYATPLLPGYELSLRKLFAAADYWTPKRTRRSSRPTE